MLLNVEEGLVKAGSFSITRTGEFLVLGFGLLPAYGLRYWHLLCLKRCCCTFAAAFFLGIFLRGLSGISSPELFSRISSSCCGKLARFLCK